MEPIAAIEKATRNRIRPIIMSALNSVKEMLTLLTVPPLLRLDI